MDLNAPSPGPRRGAYSTPTNPLAGFRGRPPVKGWKWGQRKGVGEGRRGGRAGGEGKGRRGACSIALKTPST